MKIALIAYYYPPINSSGAKRFEALSKYLAAFGHSVTVITTQKTRADGEFTERIPPGVNLIELNKLGREVVSKSVGDAYQPMFVGKPSITRRVKDLVMRWFGQVPDPRLPFALSFLYPWLAPRARTALAESDIVVGTCPPWTMLLAAVIVKRRFNIPCVLDYRDQFSDCHEMPGGVFAKWLERRLDEKLVVAGDHIVAISEPMAGYYAAMKGRVTTILNGYDPEVFEEARKKSKAQSDSGKTVIRYMGIVSPGRVPRNFMKALARLQSEAPEKFAKLKVEFYGNAALIAKEIDEFYPEISSAFGFLSPVAYLNSIEKILEADYLLFSETSSKATVSAQGILTTKLLEYIGSGRPILADISTDTLAGGLILKCEGSHLVSQSSNDFFNKLNSEEFYRRVPDLYSAVSGSLSRRAQASQYESLLIDLVNRRSVSNA